MKAYVLKEGNVWNPLLKWPRNEKCFCQKTELKAKKCCLPKVIPYCKPEQADRMKKFMEILGYR